MSRFVASRYRQAAEKKVASANATLLSDKTLNESKFEPGSASSPVKASRGKTYLLTDCFIYYFSGFREDQTTGFKKVADLFEIG